jgi:retron-type reverse transcriptase
VCALHGRTLEVQVLPQADHILIDRLKNRVNDAGVIRLVRAYLNAGIMVGGVAVERAGGTPQGGLLSPLLRLYI